MKRQSTVVPAVWHLSRKIMHSMAESRIPLSFPLLARLPIRKRACPAVFGNITQHEGMLIACEGVINGKGLRKKL